MTQSFRGPYSLAVLNSHPIQYFAPLYRRLAREPDIDLTVYYFSRAGLDRYEDEGFGGETFSWDVPLVEGYRHVFVPNVRGERTPDGFWSLVNPGIVRALRRRRHDAVWIHGHAYVSYLLGVAGALAAGSSLFMRCETHLGLRRSSLRRAFRKVLMPWFYRAFDACLAIGSRNAEFYRRHGVPDDRLFLVPYVVDNRRFMEGARLSEEERREKRRELGLPPPDVPVVLFLSKMTSRKRPSDLLEAFRRAQKERSVRAALAFVGTGPEQQRLERRVARAGISNVHFLGFRNQSVLPEIYGACDVFVLSSENEPWGLVVNEAMCAGLPVIASEEVGAAGDLVEDGENGFQYEAGDVEALARALGPLLESPQLRRRMGRASRHKIDEWGLDECVFGVKEALAATCGSRARTPSATRATGGVRIGG